jgi:hypothetical protein
MAINHTKAKEWTDIITAWLQVVGLLFAGLYALKQYRDHLKDVRVERSADYLSRLNADELFKSNTRLLMQFVSKMESTDSADMPQEQYYRFIMCDVLLHGKDQSLDTDLVSVIGFLDDGVVCSQTGLCDDEKIRSNLGEFGNDIVTTYYPYICHLRAVLKDDTYWQRVVKFYDPKSSCRDICGDFAKALNKTGVAMGSANFCGGGASKATAQSSKP